MKTALAAFSAICLSLAFAVPPVPAHEGATGVVKERMMMMDGSKKSVKALARIFKGCFSADRAIKHGEQIVLRILAEEGKKPVDNHAPKSPLTPAQMAEISSLMQTECN